MPLDLIHFGKIFLCTKRFDKLFIIARLFSPCLYELRIRFQFSPCDVISISIQVRLTKNYRSTRCIVEAASFLIQNNSKRCQSKRVLTDNSVGSKVNEFSFLIEINILDRSTYNIRYFADYYQRMLQ